MLALSIVNLNFYVGRLLSTQEAHGAPYSWWGLRCYRSRSSSSWNRGIMTRHEATTLQERKVKIYMTCILCSKLHFNIFHLLFKQALSKCAMTATKWRHWQTIVITQISVFEQMPNSSKNVLPTGPIDLSQSPCLIYHEALPVVIQPEGRCIKEHRPRPKVSGVSGWPSMRAFTFHVFPSNSLSRTLKVTPTR